MTLIQTVTGPIEHTALGLTLAHEHLFVNSAGIRENYPWMFDEEAEMAHALHKLEEAKAAGVQTLVDVSTPDLGRTPRLIRKAAEQSGINVVVATGLWLDIPRTIARRSVEEIADVFVHEIEVGLAGIDNCRAGVIKVADGDPPQGFGIGEPQEKVLRAAVQAAMRTRVPITTHTGPYTIGREQMRIFADEGVEPALVAIGHSYTDDVEYLREVLTRGHYLSIDRFGPGRDEIEAGVIKAIVQLCSDGHADHIMLGDDYGPEQWRWGPHPPDEAPRGWAYVPTEVRRKLQDAGVSAADVDTMLCAAPPAFLSGGRA
jgi:phosphotriesterase-related protein